MPVANGMPLAAIGAGEEVPPCCVTVISANACRQVAPAADTVARLQLAVFGLRGRHLTPIYSHTRRSALSVTMWVAGSGSDRCGVGACQKIAELREVASEECPTGITLLGVQPAHGTRLIKLQGACRRHIELCCTTHH